jgi:uncharacterized protein
MRILVVADTHVPDHARTLPAAVTRAASEAQVILHAGDVTGVEVLQELGRHAPVFCAAGNNDGDAIRAWGAEERLEREVAGVPFAMVHDAGPAKGRPGRLRRWFPHARAIVFGHSHIPMAFRDDGTWFLNPGSPTWKRRQEAPSMLSLTIDRRGGISPRMVVLGPEPIADLPPRRR